MGAYDMAARSEGSGGGGEKGEGGRGHGGGPRGALWSGHRVEVRLDWGMAMGEYDGEGGGLGLCRVKGRVGFRVA
jgi:hypothetical protein